MYLLQMQRPKQFIIIYLSLTDEKTKSEVKIIQSCPTLWDRMDCNPSGSSVHGILQARILSGFSFLSPGDFLDPDFEPRPPALQADSLPSEPPGKLWYILDLQCCVSFKCRVK